MSAEKDAIVELITLNQLLEERVETMERQHAELFHAYAEMHAAFQALTWTLFGAGESEQAKAFRKRYDQTKTAMWNWMNDALSHVGTGETGLGDTVAGVVQRDEADPSGNPGSPGDAKGSAGGTGG